MNQEQIAKKLNVSQSLISQIMGGQRGISKIMAVKLSEEFGGDIGFWISAKPDQIKEVLAAIQEGGDRIVSAGLS